MAIYKVDVDGHGAEALWRFSDESDNYPEPVLYRDSAHPAVWHAAVKELAK